MILGERIVDAHERRSLSQNPIPTGADTSRVLCCRTTARGPEQARVLDRERRATRELAGEREVEVAEALAQLAPVPSEIVPSVRRRASSGTTMYDIASRVR